MTKAIEKRIEELKSILSSNGSDGEDPGKVGLFIGNPDPDSIGSAMGIQMMVRKLSGAACDIIYAGEISHPQNRSLVNVLDITMVREDDEKISENYAQRIFLDQTPRGKCKDVHVDIVIDHHKSKYDNGGFVDIRSVGSCCSMVWEYLVSICDLSEDDEETSKVATAMLFGIKSDTNDLLSDNVAELDFKAYQSLVRFVDRSQVSSIVNFKIPAYYFEVRNRMEDNGNKIVQDATFVGGLGCISAARRDCLPMIADERVRMDGVSTSIIFAIVDDHLEASVRSTNPRFDVNQFCKTVFGDDFAGGKLGAGAAKVPMGVLDVKNVSDELQEEAWKANRNILMQKILRVCEDNV